MAASCIVCTRPAGEGYLLCLSCGDRLADHLHAAGDLYHELAATRARWMVLTVSAGRGGGELGLPYCEAATQASQCLVSTVTQWAHAVAQTRSSPWLVPAKFGRVAHWLAMRLDWLRALETAGEAYTQIDRAVTRARAAIDRPANRTSFPVGRCPEIRETRYCLGPVFAYVPVRIGIEPAVLRCHTVGCRRHREPWGVESWRDVGIKMLRLQAQLPSWRHTVTD
jgi:hypothetical protein